MEQPGPVAEKTQKTLMLDTLMERRAWLIDRLLEEPEPVEIRCLQRAISEIHLLIAIVAEGNKTPDESRGEENANTATGRPRRDRATRAAGLRATR